MVGSPYTEAEKLELARAHKSHPFKLPHIGHEKHLCKIWADSYDVDELRNIVKNAQFICKLCSRVAAEKENLCDPTSL